MRDCISPRSSGGTFNGPACSGRVLDGGGDWWSGRGLTVHLDARYVIEAEVPGGTAGVEVVNRGIWRTDRGDPSSGCWRASRSARSRALLPHRVQFRTEHPALQWLTESQFVGYARPEPGVVDHPRLPADLIEGAPIRKKVESR